MKLIYWILLVNFTAVNFAFAQNYPQNYFRYPLDSLPFFVSPFGAIRENHFHSGIDLKTNEKCGLPVYASAFGYVSRIKIQSGGYGKAIYIDHPNGYSTVYGHLNAFTGAIAQWIHDYQYRNQVYEFDYIFEKPFLKVNQGDTIAFSGNSGTSTGPHLHFEIRHSKTEEIINPAYFGIYPKDTLSPVIRQINFYSFLDDGLNLIKKVNIPSRMSDGFDSMCFLPFDTIELPANDYGLGIEAADFIHQNRDEKNIFAYQLIINNETRFIYKMSRFAFAETKDVNVHIDYPYFKTTKNKIQKVFLDDGNSIRLYQYDNRKGKFRIEKDSFYSCTIIVKDYRDNLIKASFVIKGTNMQLDKDIIHYEKEKRKRIEVLPNFNKEIHFHNLNIQFQSASLYDTLFIDINKIKLLNKLEAYKIHYPYVPLKKPIQISIKCHPPKQVASAKMLMVFKSDNDARARAITSEYKNGVLKANMSSFGIVYPFFDTIAPLVSMLSYRKDIEERSDTAAYYFKISDELSGISQYELYINGKWVLSEYDAKNQLLTYHFDEMFPEFYASDSIESNKNKIDIFLRVKDNKANLTEKHFYLTNPFIKPE